MKKMFFALIALIVAQSAFAQIVSKADPIGTVYTYNVDLSGSELSLQYTLISVEDDCFAFDLYQELPMGMSALELKTAYVIQNGMLLQNTEEMEKFVKEQMSKIGAAGAKVDIEGGSAPLSLQGKVGDEIELNQMIIKMTVMGMPISSVNKVLSNKVIAAEKITVPAGTFETIVQEIVIEVSEQAMGQTKSVTSTSKYWIAPGMGVIKAVLDDGKGSISTQELKEIRRP